MKISMNEVRELVETLPIGLYASRRVPCEMSDKEPTSYYNPADDVIVISYPIIAEGLKNATIDENYTSETAIRSMMYHELSHVILTPCNKDFMNSIPMYVPFDIFNIFEDERIETVFKDFYLDVNFKKNILYINGGSVPEPIDAQGIFYNLVRFRIDYDGLLPEVDRIISEYSDITSKGDEDSDYRLYHHRREYLSEIEKLWDKVQKSAKRNGMPSMPSESELSKMISEMMNGNEWNTENNSSAPEKKTECSCNGDGEKSDKDGDGDRSGENMVSKEEDGEPDKNNTSGGKLNQLFDSVFDTMDNSVYETLSAIIGQFNKKNKGGSGINTYSGVFNPRAVMRDDYRYFERSTTVNGNNRFGTLHLNLMLDNSGSYYQNCEATNRIIQALIEIEKRNRNFTFDVYFIADNYVKAKNNKERYIRATGGNELHPELLDLVRKAQKPNTFNYNIAMFDGRAYCHTDEAKYFKAFDRNNFTIISDSSNSFELNKHCPNAKIIIENDKYVQKLSDHVINALSNAFR